MKKTIFLIVPLLLMASFSSGFCKRNYSKNDDKTIHSVNDITGIFGDVVKTYLNKDYSDQEYKVAYGNYYKVGVMGHRQKVLYGRFRLCVDKIEDYISSRAVGDSSNITFSESYSYSVTTTTTASEQVKIGTTNIVNATTKQVDTTTTGTNSNTTTEYTMGYTRFYSKTLSRCFKVDNNLNLNIIPSDKKIFSYSRVSLYLECDIQESYTQEQRWIGGWCKLNNTSKENYYCRTYLADILTYCYNDGTFGNTDIGVYNLGVIKEY